MATTATQIIDPPGLSTKKTLFIMVTVVGCIAILWPKVFYPMMFGSPIKQNEHRIGTTLRQERPPHLRPESIHPAMRERGRAIPETTSIPIVERARSPSSPPPRIVEGRPGPVPGIRPPLGAGSVHQAPQKTSSMGFIMPLYTIGIVAFFIYTIMKILFKKPIANPPYDNTTRSDPSFHKEVFGHEKSCCKGYENCGSTKLGCNHHHSLHNRNVMMGQTYKNDTLTSRSNNIVNHTTNAAAFNSNGNCNIRCQQYLNNSNYTSSTSFLSSSSSALISSSTLHNRERDQTMEIEKLRRKLEETEKAMAKLIAEMSSDCHNLKDITTSSSTSSEKMKQNLSNTSNGHANPLQTNDLSNKHHNHLHINETELNESQQQQQQQQKGHEKSNENNSNDNNCDYANDDTETTTIEKLLKKNDSNKLERKKLDDNYEKTVVVLGMEMTASCEGGEKWNRPTTPVFIHHVQHPAHLDEDKPDPQSIYLEGALPHESQILVSDSKIDTEKVVDEELNGSIDEPAVVLSSKMTLSLINLSSENLHEKKDETDDSPLDNSMEIINRDEHTKDKKEFEKTSGI